MSDTAEAEADQTFFWLAGRSPEMAGRWYVGLLVAYQSLAQFPGRCPLAPENDSFESVEVRQLLYGPGRSTYRILLPDIHKGFLAPQRFRTLLRLPCASSSVCIAHGHRALWLRGREPYSYRIASMGSFRDAFTAGATPKSTPTPMQTLIARETAFAVMSGRRGE